MKFRQIEDRLIQAERIVLDLHETRVGPKPLRGQQLPYVHSESDMRNWGHRKGDRRSADPRANACRLRKEDDEAYSIFRAEFWEQFKDEPTQDDAIGAVELRENWIHLVDDENERRALLAWAYAMAGGRPFKRWCRMNDISVMTGRRRKNRAVEKISRQLQSKSDLRATEAGFGVLPVTPEIGDVSPTLAEPERGTETGLNSWASDDAFQPIVIHREVINDHVAVQRIEVTAQEFSWAAKRNARRRQQEAKRRARLKEAEAAAQKVAA